MKKKALWLCLGLCILSEPLLAIDGTALQTQITSLSPNTQDFHQLQELLRMITVRRLRFPSTAPTRRRTLPAHSQQSESARVVWRLFSWLMIGGLFVVCVGVFWFLFVDFVGKLKATRHHKQLNDIRNIHRKTNIPLRK